MGKNKQYREPRMNFTIRLSREERDFLDKCSKAKSLKPSEYVRQLIMSGGNIDTNKMKDRRDLIEQIARIGNNINQITRLANASKYIDDKNLRMISYYQELIVNLMKQNLTAWT